MRKIYKCGGTQPSINVLLPNGKPFHVTFTPHSGGGSVYDTCDENIQYGIEHHHKYGKLFTGHVVEVPVAPVVQVPEEPTSTYTVITVSSLEEATEYLATNFGISRSKCKSPAAILKNAEKNNIKFEGCAAIENHDQ